MYWYEVSAVASQQYLNSELTADLFGNVCAIVVPQQQLAGGTLDSLVHEKRKSRWYKTLTTSFG